MRRAVSALAATVLALVLLLHFKTVPLAGRPKVVLVRPLAGTPVVPTGQVVASAAGVAGVAGIGGTSLTAGSRTATTSPGARVRKPAGPRPLAVPRPGVRSGRGGTTALSTPATPSTSVPGMAADSTGPSTIATPAPTTTVPPAPVSTIPTVVRVITGPVVTIPTGSVQVQLTLHGTQITDVTTLQMPEAFVLSHALSTLAAPILRAETLIAQNAVIDTVSGATLTSKAYAESLQAALDQARH